MKGSQLSTCKYSSKCCLNQWKPYDQQTNKKCKFLSSFLHESKIPNLTFIYQKYNHEQWLNFSKRPLSNKNKDRFQDHLLTRIINQFWKSKSRIFTNVLTHQIVFDAPWSKYSWKFGFIVLELVVGSNEQESWASTRAVLL